MLGKRHDAKVRLVGGTWFPMIHYKLRIGPMTRSSTILKAILKYSTNEGFMSSEAHRQPMAWFKFVTTNSCLHGCVKEENIARAPIIYMHLAKAWIVNIHHNHDGVRIR